MRGLFQVVDINNVNVWVETAQTLQARAAMLRGPSIDTTLGSAPDERAVKIVAKSIYSELIAGGWREEDVLELATELLSRVTHGVRDRRDRS